MTEKEKFIRDNFDIKELYKIGFIKTKTDFVEIERRICEFFELKNIYMYDFIMTDKKQTIKANIKTFSQN